MNYSYLLNVLLLPIIEVILFSLLPLGVRHQILQLLVGCLELPNDFLSIAVLVQEVAAFIIRDSLFRYFLLNYSRFALLLDF